MATSKEKVLELVAKDAYRLLPEKISGVGETIEPHCNDCMKIYIEVNPRQVVTYAAYELTDGACGTVIAAAAAAVELAMNKPVMTAYSITKDAIAQLMSDDGILDKEHVHCAMMAELSMKRAVVDYVQKAVVIPAN